MKSRRLTLAFDNYKNTRLGIFLNLGIGVVFVIAAAIVVITVNYGMRQQALVEAQSKARIILDRNLATHAYFSQIMKPSIFAWTKPFRGKEYFDHTWMSSTYAIREIEKYFKSFNPSGYSFKDAAINARSPENEADEYERAFLEKLNVDKKLESESVVRKIDGKFYLVVLRKGEVMESSCLKCHSNPKEAPKGLTDYYGSERSFNRKAGYAVSAVSLRVPLSEAYAAANIFSLKISAILLIVLACLFTIQYRFYRRYLLKPLDIMRKKANEIAMHEEHLGEQIPQPFGKELRKLTTTFNEMSIKLRYSRDHLEKLVVKRTELLQESEERYRSLFENMLDGFAYCEMFYDEQDRPVDFVYLDVNKTFEQLTGLKNVVGKQVSEVIPDIKELNPELLDIYGQVALTGKSERFEIEFKPLAKWLSISVYSTKKGYFTVVFDDITYIKEKEKKIVYERNRLRTLLENAPFGIMLIDWHGLISYINPKFTEILGYEQDDIPNGKTWFKMAYPDEEGRHSVISAWVDNLKDAGIGESRPQTFIVRCKDGMQKIINFIPVQLESGEYLVTLEDRTELHRYQENLAYSAIHDALTGLLNRRSLEDMLSRTIAKAKRGTVSSLFYMDLDNFKDVNDTVGHSAGDEALIIFTGLLKEVFRTEDIVFRVGGDEFAVLLEGVDGKEALPAAERLRVSVETHIFEFDNHVFPLSLSIGLIEIDGTMAIGGLLSKADAAMYRAKKEGKNRIVVT